MSRKLNYIATKEIDIQYYFVEGEKIRIEGEVMFGQDFSWWQGTFDNLLFTVSKVNSDKSNQWVSLKAKGYGEDPGSDNYGAGAIFVYKEDFHKLIKVKETTATVHEHSQMG